MTLDAEIPTERPVGAIGTQSATQTAEEWRVEYKGFMKEVLSRLDITPVSEDDDHEAGENYGGSEGGVSLQLFSAAMQLEDVRL